MPIPPTAKDPRVERLLEEGLTFYGMWQFREAATCWKEALKLDPANTAAAKYLESVAQEQESRGPEGTEPRLLDLLEETEIAGVLDASAADTGMAVTVTDAHGDSVAPVAGITEFCGTFTLGQPSVAPTCEQNYRQGAQEALKRGRLFLWKCPYGLGCYAAPLRVGGRVLGYMTGGEFLDHRADPHLLAQKAPAVGAKPDRYEGALKKLARMDPTEVLNRVERIQASAAELSRKAADRIRASLEGMEPDVEASLERLGPPEGGRAAGAAPPAPPPPPPAGGAAWLESMGQGGEEELWGPPPPPAEPAREAPPAAEGTEAGSLAGALLEAAARVKPGMEAAAVARLLLEAGLNALSLDAGGVVLWDDRTSEFRGASFLGLPPPESETIPREDPVLSRLVASDQPQPVAPEVVETSFLGKEASALRWGAIPLKRGARLLGYLLLGGRSALPELDRGGVPLWGSELSLLVDLSSELSLARERSWVDPPTDLPNAAVFLQRMREETYRARRYLAPLGLLVFELELAAGSDAAHRGAILRRAAQALRAGIRQADILGRLEGEQFGLLLPHTFEPIVLHVAGRLKRSLEKELNGTGATFLMAVVSFSRLKIPSEVDFLKEAEAILAKGRTQP